MSSAKERKERDEIITVAKSRLTDVEGTIKEMTGSVNEIKGLIAEKKNEIEKVEVILKGGTKAILRHRAFENKYNVVSKVK